MRGAAARIMRERNDAAWLAWHIAALVRAKKRLPPLKALMTRPARRGPAQTMEQQQQVAKMLTMMHGGTVH